MSEEAREGTLECLEEAWVRFHAAYSGGIFAESAGLNHHRREEDDLLEGELKPVYGMAAETASASKQAKGGEAHRRRQLLPPRSCPDKAAAAKAAAAKQAAAAVKKAAAAMAASAKEGCSGESIC
ncbi:hypothetical protein CYMTET_18253 [Cymbomonas tetramitiformis]|uniref:Uncharacterized protein n=1 Tax=Cymbomonas tetramitiformis TaxID=36881 RepID=A0AAE0L640_9CHLO|nr:hypothetical protein CYMTET_18253 [Cymbomonas tetramitiformis]